jgi:hypothetical protein
VLPTSRRLARGLALRVPPLGRIVADRDRERAQRRKLQGQLAAYKRGYPPGHYYSPIPDLDDVRARELQIFDRTSPEVAGIDLRPAEQLSLVPEFARFYAEQPFADEPAGGLRYGFANAYFGYGDGLALYAMLRHLQPKRLVEVGSGWSSALALDVNDRFLDGAMQCTFLEPYPARLHELLRPADKDRARIVEQPLHAVPDEVFSDLAAGDLLFIDSTHVSRIGSDVNRLFLEIVPSLPPGVHVHVHDVFWPFEYPEEWVYEGRAWNESYLLRALLVDNDRLRVTWFNDYLGRFHADAVGQAMPWWRRNPGGSIYIETC